METTLFMPRGVEPALWQKHLEVTFRKRYGPNCRSIIHTMTETIVSLVDQHPFRSDDYTYTNVFQENWKATLPPLLSYLPDWVAKDNNLLSDRKL
jgi:hypothetical protein